MAFTRYYKFAIFLLTIMSCVSVYGQTQQGYVKTKGRLGNNGSVIAGTRLQGATVSVRGGNAVVSGNNGAFSLAIPKGSYFLQNVQKQGYVLTDPDVLSKQYAYSKNPLVLVLETRGQHDGDKLAAERKIRRTLQRQLQEKEDEIETLKEQNKISEEEYRKQLQEIYARQESNEMLISEMADRYSRVDFDEVDEFNRRISSMILEGNLTEADSLLKTKGDINYRATQLFQHQEANAKVRKDLEKSEALTQKEREDLAQDCYSKFEILNMTHAVDSALHYIELRASLDTANYRWQNDVGQYVLAYTTDYSKSLSYFQRILNQELSKPDSICSYDWLSSACNNISGVFKSAGLYEEALEYAQYSLNFTSDDDDAARLHRANSFNTLGSVYYRKQNMHKALDCYHSALERFLSCEGDSAISVATVSDNIGLVYQGLGDYAEALKFHNRALSIFLKTHGYNHQDVATCLDNIGSVHSDMGNMDEAEKISKQVFEIRLRLFGENHPDVALSCDNLSSVYYRKGDYAEAAKYGETALLLYRRLYPGVAHLDVAICLENLGETFTKMERHDDALKCYEEAERIYLKFYPEYHSTVSRVKRSIRMARLGTIKPILPPSNSSIN